MEKIEKLLPYFYIQCNKIIPTSREMKEKGNGEKESKFKVIPMVVMLVLVMVVTSFVSVDAHEGQYEEI